MNILIAEDDWTSRRILESMLAKWGYDVTSVDNGTDAWKMIQGCEGPKLAILDWMMPGMEGVEICRQLRKVEKDEDQYTYIILLTAKGSKENIVIGMDAGADDYIVKPFDQHELRVRVRAGERIINLQSELLSAKKELLMQSRTDPLTGILNRRAILMQLDKELARAAREYRNICISMLDIDHFKKVNDTYGHASGDVILQQCVKQINTAIRTYDTLGRFGGEEFLIVIPGADERQGAQVCERIRMVIEKSVVVQNGADIRITASQGLAVWEGRLSAEELIALADQALYQAKNRGRNCIEIAVAEPERATCG